MVSHKFRAAHSRNDLSTQKKVAARFAAKDSGLVG